MDGAAREVIYLVRGMRGEYSDRTEWTVCGYRDKAAAEAYVIECERQCRALAAKFDNRWGGDEEMTDLELFKLRLTLPDPYFDPEGYGARDVSYTVEEAVIGNPAAEPLQVYRDFAHRNGWWLEEDGHWRQKSWNRERKAWDYPPGPVFTTVEEVAMHLKLIPDPNAPPPPPMPQEWGAF